LVFLKQKQLLKTQPKAPLEWPEGFHTGGGRVCVWWASAGGVGEGLLL
jgi:hypothetical protein